MAQIISGIESALRPAAKQLIKGGLVVSKSLSGFVVETGDELRNLVKEAKIELKQPHAPKAVKSHVVKARSVTGGLRDRLATARHFIREGASDAASTTNEAIIALVAWFKGESKEEAEAQVKKDEKILKRIGEDLTKDECLNVIETLILVAV